MKRELLRTTAQLLALGAVLGTGPGRADGQGAPGAFRIYVAGGTVLVTTPTGARIGQPTPSDSAVVELRGATYRLDSINARNVTVPRVRATVLFQNPESGTYRVAVTSTGPQRGTIAASRSVRDTAWATASQVIQHGEGDTYTFDVSYSAASGLAPTIRYTGRRRRPDLTIHGLGGSLLITDAQGRRTGQLSPMDSMLQAIPTAYYSPDENPDCHGCEDEAPEPPGPELFLANAGTGVYRLRLLATFTIPNAGLWVTSSTPSDRLHTQEIRFAIQKDSIYHFELVYDRDSEGAPRLSRVSAPPPPM